MFLPVLLGTVLRLENYKAAIPWLPNMQPYRGAVKGVYVLWRQLPDFFPHLIVIIPLSC